MTRIGSTVVVLASSLAWLALLFAVEPFVHVNAALDRAFGALPAWTQVEKMYSNPVTQELSRGENPLPGLQVVEQAWAARRSVPRIVLMGNSQTQMTSLAKGEAPPRGPEKTYTDQLADHYCETGSAVFYRLSAGAMSYEEMLWYTAYLANRPALKPSVLLVQLNYQNFANGGIRGGMASLLADPAFRQTIEDLVRRRRPESPELAETLEQYQRSERNPGAVNVAQSAGGQATAGYRVETGFRRQLDRIPGFEQRAALKQSFFLTLIRCRTYLLRVAPSARRSLAGVRVNASRGALEDLADLCRRSGIRLILFHAPTNPLVPLYGTAQDDRSYHEFTASIAARYGFPLLDFEHGVPARYWGMALNVPDPLHLGRDGHRLFAGQMLAALQQNGL